MDQGSYRNKKKQGSISNQGRYGENNATVESASWICPNCETINTEMTCVLCGYKKESSNDSSSNQTEHLSKWIKIMVAVFLVITATVLIKGMIDNSQQLGSSRIENDPQLLNEKGLAYHTSQDTFAYKKNNGTMGITNYCILDTPVNNCKSLTAEVTIQELRNGNVMDWALYIRMLNGNWRKVKTFSLNAGKAEENVFFDEPVSFDAYFFACMSMGKNADFDWIANVNSIQSESSDQNSEHEHSFSEATCTEAKTCSDCGITEGNPLGHDFTDSTCASSGTCKRCGITSGKKLAHHWLSATYDAPATCELCGVTRGSVKGYYPTWYGYWADKKVGVSGTNAYPWVFAQPISNCKKFTMHFQITSVEYGEDFGEFKLYYKSYTGQWKKIGSFDVHDQSEVIKTFEFNDPISITQLAVTPPQRGSFIFHYNLWFEDWYLQN